MEKAERKRAEESPLHRHLIFVDVHVPICMQGIRKILLWDHIKTQPRFRPFQDKIVHLVLDDAQAFADPDPKAIFALEGLQEKARWESFLHWNEHTAFFQPEDLVGFGDADEIASRENVNLLRYCEMAGPSVEIGS